MGHTYSCLFLHVVWSCVGGLMFGFYSFDICTLMI